MNIGFAVDEAIFADLQRIAFVWGWALFPFDIDQFTASKFIVVSPKVTSNTIPSPLICGMILSRAHIDSANKFQSHASQLLPHFDEKRLLFYDADMPEEDLCGWMARTSSDFTATVLTHAAAADRELASLRILFEKAQATIAQIESLPELAPTTRMHCQALPGKGRLSIGKSPLSFHLLKEADAIFAIDLFFLKKGEPALGASFYVNLIGAETERVIASWQIPEADVVGGWNRFYCPTTQEPYLEQVILQVRASGDRAQSLLAEADLHTVSGIKVKAGQSPFAFRIWKGVVGLKIPHLAPGHLAQGEDEIVSTGRHPAASQFLQMGISRNPETSSSQVSWSERDEGLMVHPAGEKPVVAHVQGIDVVDLLEIRVGCKLAHEQGATTQFAIWIEPHDGPRRPLSGPPSGGLAGKFANRFLSGPRVPEDVVWLTLQGGEVGECSVTLASPYSGRLDLCLATRNLSKSSTYSWAVFTDLHFRHAQLAR